LRTGWVRLRRSACALLAAYPSSPPPLPERSDCWHITSERSGPGREGRFTSTNVARTSASTPAQPSRQEPGRHSRNLRSRTGAFEKAWQRFLPLCSEVDLTEHRRQRALQTEIQGCLITPVSREVGLRARRGSAVTERRHPRCASLATTETKLLVKSSERPASPI
jgi:hypothetical protein